MEWLKRGSVNGQITKCIKYLKPHQMYHILFLKYFMLSVIINLEDIYFYRRNNTRLFQPRYETYLLIAYQLQDELRNSI